MTIQIGELVLQNVVAAAPMSGVSDAPFRAIAAEAGAGLVVSEMVASAELAGRRADMVRRAENLAGVKPFVIQLAGRDAHWMAKGAELAEAAGADIVDINMGCPARQVTGALSGSALMRDPDHAISLVKATLEGTSKPVTLKMRLGWDWDCLNAAEIARRAEDAGVSLITVHGRVRNQFYKGVANWRAIEDVKDAVAIPVIANGDIVDLASARQALAESGADGVMIGRAATGRAWLPGRIAAALANGSASVDVPTLEEQTTLFLRQYAMTIDHYGPRLGVRVARKHLAAFIDAAPIDLAPLQRRHWRAALCRLDDPAAVTDAIEGASSGVFSLLNASSADPSSRDAAAA